LNRFQCHSAMIHLMLDRLVPSETDAAFHYREAA
jgi:hypothetical protein